MRDTNRLNRLGWFSPNVFIEQYWEYKLFFVLSWQDQSQQFF